MSLTQDDLLKEISKLKAVENMKISAKSAIKSGTAVGAATIVSGILGGAVGLAVGGVISSCIAGYMSRNSLKSVPYILLYETTPEQREKLAEGVRKLIQPKHINTIRDFVFAINSNQQLVETILQLLVMFLTSEMGLKVVV